MKFYNYSIILLQMEPSTAFLRAARAGQLQTVKELLDTQQVRDINTCNSVSDEDLLSVMWWNHNIIGDVMKLLKFVVIFQLVKLIFYMLGCSIISYLKKIIQWFVIGLMGL